VTGLGSFGIYEVLIRPFGVMRFLFGLKPRLNSTGPRSHHRHPGARSEPGTQATGQTFAVREP